MLYISFDENGDFEKASKKNGNRVWIGGLIYDDHDHPKDYENEKKRIDCYLRAVCEHENAWMPSDLHSGDEKRSKIVSHVKKQIKDTLGQFLQKGTCDFEDNTYSDKLKKLPPRKGTYHLFIYLKHGVGMERLISKTMSDFVKDDVASNLYVHMITETLERMIFHNPVIKDVKRVNLDLPTRAYPVKQNSEGNKEFERFEYKEINSKGKEADREVTYSVANSDIYRTILEHEMIQPENEKVQIEDFHVGKIEYYRVEDTKKFAFLYLCDFICGIEVDTASSQKMIAGIKNKLDNLTGYKEGTPETNLVFAYDEIDLIYKDAIARLEQKDYYEVLRLIYEGEHSKSPYAGFYSDVWFPCLEQSLKHETDTDAYSIALRKFYLSSRRNNLDQKELIRVFRGLESMRGSMNFRSKEDEESTLYELYDAGTSAFCHIGDSLHAEQCFEKCMECSENVETERFLRTKDKMVVFLTDSFRFSEALENAKDDEAVHECLLEVKDLPYGQKKGLKEYGISLSQTGQILSFMHDCGAEQKFLDALKYMEEGTPDYNQTMSYLLHYYLSMGEEEKYDKMAVRYFGGKTTPKEQFRYIVMEGGKGRQASISMKFAMYVFIKGVYLFHMEDGFKGLKLIFDDIDKRIREIGGEEAAGQINNHPWEIIYKYLALAAENRGSEKLAHDYMDKAEKVLGEERGFTLDAVCLFGRLEYARKCGDNEEEKNILDQLTRLFKKNYCEEYVMIDPEDAERTYDYLKENVFGYMYS